MHAMELSLQSTAQYYSVHALQDKRVLFKCGSIFRINLHNLLKVFIFKGFAMMDVLKKRSATTGIGSKLSADQAAIE